VTSTEEIAPELETGFRQPYLRRHAIAFSLLAALLVLVGLAVFEYLKFARTIAARLEKEPQGSIAVYYAAPRILAVGEESSPTSLLAELQNANYGDSPAPS
jgi:hypothetical protein